MTAEIRLSTTVTGSRHRRCPPSSHQKLFHFQKVDMADKSGGERDTELGLIEGVLDSRDVLTGFYSEEDYDSEGVSVRGFMAPVVLYKAGRASTPLSSQRRTTRPSVRRRTDPTVA